MCQVRGIYLLLWNNGPLLKKECGFMKKLQHSWTNLCSVKTVKQSLNYMLGSPRWNMDGNVDTHAVWWMPWSIFVAPFARQVRLVASSHVLLEIEWQRVTMLWFKVDFVSVLYFSLFYTYHHNCGNLKQMTKLFECFFLNYYYSFAMNLGGILTGSLSCSSVKFVTYVHV